jgi:putative flippase GtrA
MIARAFTVARELVLARYLLASVVALGADVGTFLLLLAIGSAAAPASAAGYALGIVAHWLLSSRTVFVAGVAARGPERNRQKVMFVASALLGLLLTTMVVAAGTAAGIDPRLAKLAAIGLSFSVTWLLRSRVIFRFRQPAENRPEPC